MLLKISCKYFFPLWSHTLSIFSTINGNRYLLTRATAYPCAISNSFVRLYDKAWPAVVLLMFIACPAQKAAFCIFTIAFLSHLKYASKFSIIVLIA